METLRGGGEGSGRWTMANEEDGTAIELEDVASSAALVGSGRVAKFCLGFGIQVVMARFLGSTNYGGVILTTMMMTVGTVLAAVGLEKGLVRKVSYHLDEADVCRGVVWSSLKITVVTGFLAGAIMFVSAPVLATVVFDDPAVEPLMRLGAVGVPFAVLSRIGVAVARGAGDATTHVAVRQLLNPTFTFVFAGVPLAIGFGAYGAIAGMVLASIGVAIAALYLMVRALPFTVHGPRREMSWPLLAFSLPLLLAKSMEFVIYHTDTFLVGAFLTSGEVGIYYVAFQLRNLGVFFFFPATFLIPPALTRFVKRGDRLEARRVYQVTTKWMVFLTTPIFLFVFLFPGVVIELPFGPEYLPGTTTLQILIAQVMITVLLSANGIALVALGHNHVNMYVDAAAAVTNVLLNVLLIPPFGIAGAALASFVSLAGRDVLYSVALYRWEGIHPFSSALLRPMLGSFALAGIAYGILVTSTDGRPLSVTVAGLAYLLAYPILLVALGGIEREDERLLSLVEDRLGVTLWRLRTVLGRLQR